MAHPSVHAGVCDLGILRRDRVATWQDFNQDVRLVATGQNEERDACDDDCSESGEDGAVAGHKYSLWCMIIRNGPAAPEGRPTESFVFPALGDGVPATGAERDGRHFQPDCRLSAFELVDVDESQDAADQSRVIAGLLHDALQAAFVFDGEFDDAIEHFVRWQAVLIGLIGT